MNSAVSRRGNFAFRARAALALGALIAVGCAGALDTAPEVVIPLEGEHPRAPESSSAPSASAASPEAPSRDALQLAPDPEPIETRDWFELELRYERGKLRVLAVREKKSEGLRYSERRMGRFALEQAEGAILLDRVRFDFPFLAGQESDALTAGLVADATVLVPRLEATTMARIVDRKTGEILPVELRVPPEQGATSSGQKP